MPPRGEGLQTQDTGPCVKSLGVVGELPPQLSILHAAQIGGQEKAGVRGDGVQLDINCRKDSGGGTGEWSEETGKSLGRTISHIIASPLLTLPSQMSTKESKVIFDPGGH